MTGAATIAGGFAETGAGAWLAARGQPAAFCGATTRRRRKGWIVRDRARLEHVETSGSAKFSISSRPFLTHVQCAAPVSAVSSKVLVAPLQAHAGSEMLKPIPMGVRGAICVSRFDKEWVVLATVSRTTRIVVEDGETLSVRPEAAVAWTGGRPTGFCPKIGVLDMLLPRGPRNLLLHFHGPCIVWAEGAPEIVPCAAGRRVF